MKLPLQKKSFRDSHLFRLFNTKLPLFQTEAIWAIIGVFIALPFAFFLLQILLPVDPTSLDSIRFEVQAGESSYEIANNLAEAGLIRSRTGFYVYSFVTGRAFRLQSGEYLLSPGMTTHRISRILTSGNTVQERITILEGWNLRNIAEEFERLGIFTQEEFFRATGYPAIDYREDFSFPSPPDYSREFSLLEDKPLHVSLEGYLFPDTYFITANETPERFVRRALQNFEDNISEELLTEIEAQEKTIFEVINFASLLEKEVPTFTEKQTVAGILQKRMDNDVRLQVDAPIVYVREGNYYKVTISETQIDSPYNTYRVEGLPLGPIANPGLESIEAALNPIESPYWFYLSARDGTTIYSRTFEEHTAAKERYLR